jgi:hypothetical protein
MNEHYYILPFIPIFEETIIFIAYLLLIFHLI